MSNARLIARPLTAEAFAPYGHVIELPKSGHIDLVAELVNARKGRADARLALTAIEPIALPYEFSAMEAHQHSSQAFVPIDVSRYLLVVATSTPDGKPDLARMQSFMAGPQQSLIYAPGIWHQPMRVLDRAARFAIFTFIDGTAADETWATLPRAMIIADG
jgi:ureidoglycolate lyase